MCTVRALDHRSHCSADVGGELENGEISADAVRFVYTGPQLPGAGAAAAEDAPAAPEIVLAPEQGPAPLEVDAIAAGVAPDAICSWDFGDWGRRRDQGLETLFVGMGLSLALDEVKERVALIRNLPATAEEPEISRVVRYEPVARLVVHGPGSLRELRGVARRIAVGDQVETGTVLLVVETSSEEGDS